MSLACSWLAFEGADFTGRLYVLEEGSYSDLKSMGCVQGTSILSLQTIGFVGVFKCTHRFRAFVANISVLLHVPTLLASFQAGVSRHLGFSRSSLCRPSLCLSAAVCGARGWS